MLHYSFSLQNYDENLIYKVPEPQLFAYLADLEGYFLVAFSAHSIKSDIFIPNLIDFMLFFDSICNAKSLPSCLRVDGEPFLYAWDGADNLIEFTKYNHLMEIAKNGDCNKLGVVSLESLRALLTKLLYDLGLTFGQTSRTYLYILSHRAPGLR